MSEAEKYWEIHEMLLKLPVVKASDDFMVKLQQKINLSEAENTYISPKKSVFRRFILIPSLSLGIILIAGIIIWSALLNKSKNEIGNVNLTPNVEEQKQNLIPDTKNNNIAQEITKSSERPQMQQSQNLPQKSNERVSKSSRMDYYNEPPSSDNKINESIPITPKSDVSYPPTQPVKGTEKVEPAPIKMMESPKTNVEGKVKESKRSTAKDYQKDFNNGILPDSREKGISNSTQTTTIISSPPQKVPNTTEPNSEPMKTTNKDKKTSKTTINEATKKKSDTSKTKPSESKRNSDDSKQKEQNQKQ